MRGEGLAVFKDETINGGDHAYLYLGSYKEAGDSVTAKLKIKKWNNSAISVFGPLKDFDLELQGNFQSAGAAFQVTGHTPQMPGATITIIGNRLADAV